ncbi:hypothetical protein BsWGS_03078 [Bradybaena similaris]
MVPIVGLVSLVWVLSCLMLSHGAVFGPTQCCTCDTMMPKNIPGGRIPQVVPSPFRIEVKEYEYNLVSEIHVSLVGPPDQFFRSFMLAAYAVPYARGHMPVGQIKALQGQNFQVREDCIQKDGTPDSTANSYAVISQDDNPKRNLNFVWTANRHYSHVEFRATFVVNDNIFWVSEKSRLLGDPKAGPLPLPKNRITTAINTDHCGNTKGCFREPPGCIEPQCLYILTWRSESGTIDFELGGLADSSIDRYVAVGLSEDTYMGGDTVMTCAHNSETGRTEIFLSYNTADPKDNIPIPKYGINPTTGLHNDNTLYRFIDSEEGSYDNGRLRCRFRIKRDLEIFHPELQPIRGGPKHLLFAHGFAVKGSPKRHGLSVEELPLASAGRVDFTYFSNSFGRATYSLAKAHGCLMILAWIFFASIGLLLTKYYKPMWPESRMFDHKYWFLGHFNCMATMFIITIIAIIIIFVEAGGYSQAPDLPQKAHPILGIIILICIIINPILALIRPSEDNKCRPVFNWFHWAFGTIANVLAIPQIFIGMDFGKVMVPWWATWILVVWVIFHIAVELTLEIHQCCTYKKNKERRKKWEREKREYPKQHFPEPQPAGRKFKQFMLFLHIGFTAVITLFMIIVIAVS